MSVAEPEAPEEAAARAARIEKGRLYFAKPWGFLMGAAKPEGLPPADGVEVAFAGRSNVGKSSLLNALVGQKALARTSNTPGRTREVNFFGAGTDLSLVDMPGYGYAKAEKKLADSWSRLVFAYLRGRPNLRRAYVLIDSRRGLMANDREVLDLLDKTAVSYQLVLTKADKLRKGEAETVAAATTAAIAKRPAAYPVVLVTSAETGGGIDLLRAEIASLAG